MANVFKNAKVAVGNTATSIYTAPAATTSIVIGCVFANVDGTNACNLTCTWTDDSDSDAITNLCYLVSIPPNSSIALIGGANGKLVLEAGDILKATAGATGDLEATVSVLEIS